MTNLEAYAETLLDFQYITEHPDSQVPHWMTREKCVKDIQTQLINLANSTREFQKRFDMFLKGCEEILVENHKRFPNLRMPWFEVHHGNRYIKVMQCNDWNKDACVASGMDPSKGVSRRSHVYVDKTTGDVLKGNWKGPTKPKVARGNIFDQANGLKYMGAYGPKYLEEIKELQK